MSKLKICRVCLKYNVRGYNCDEFNLQQYYEHIMGSKALDQMPHWFCFECSTMLHKFHKFRDKCFIGQKMLERILKKGPITYDTIHKANKTAEHLQTSLRIIQTNKHVKTYVVKHKYVGRVLDKNSREIEPSQIYRFTYDRAVEYTEELIKDESTPVLVEQSMHEFDDENDGAMVDTNEEKAPQQMFVLIPEPELVLTDPTTNNEVKTSNYLQSVNDVKVDDGSSMDGDDNDDVIESKKKESVDKKEQKRPDRTKKFKFERKKQDLLTADYWKKYQLTEEEALIEFKKKELSEKFTKMDYKCTDCFKGFSKQHILMRHINFKHKESLGPYACRFCGMRFRLKHYMTHHMQEHYRVYHCLLCDKKFSVKNSANLHERYHSGRLIKCKHCGEGFKHQSTYYTHIREFHRSNHICSVCGASFVSEMGLTQHRNIKHYDNEHVGASETEVIMKIYCSKCDIKFVSQQAYDEHLVHSNMHDEVTDTENMNLKGGKLLSKGSGRVRRIPSTCKYCGLKFESREAGRRHHLAVHPQQVERVMCHICGASLKEPSMVSHMNSHTRARLFPCELCGRECISKMVLKRHMVEPSMVSHMNSHTRTRPFPCELCGRECISKMVLKRHMVTHTGEKPYPCSLCDKRFTQSASLQLHHKTFHLKMPYPKRNRRIKTPSED